MSEQGPTVFNGRYELLRHIARGGMADVYLARDELLDREVALKVLFPEFANEPNFVERFRREAQAAANLNHPNIVGIYDWGQERGTYYIVMEYVRGRSMADVLRSTGPLQADRAAEIAADVAGALATAHAAGLVHRDVKLGNILVSDDGNVKVADFGIATALAGGTEAGLTAHGSVMGTATYFSPEQAQGKPVDGRSDLYSLGVVLYEMLAGVPPFQADTPVAVAYKHVQERPQTLSDRGVNVAQSLEAITMKLLAKNPGNRYPAADDLRSDLRRYLAGAHTIPGRAAAAGAGVAAGAAAAAAVSPPVAPPPDPHPPMVDPAPLGATAAQPVTPAGGYGAPVDPTAHLQQPQYQAPAQPQYQPGFQYYDEPEPEGGDSWLRSAGMLVVLAALVGLLGFLVVAFWNSLGGGDDGADDGEETGELITLENFVGEEVQDARAALLEVGLEVDIEFETNSEIPENQVFRQDPVAGQRVEEGSTVVLTVSTGDALLVNGVVGQTEAEARASLEAQGYSVLVETENSQQEEGTVIRQDPLSGQELPAGEAVTITVSLGPVLKPVPDVEGMSVVQATTLLGDEGFRVAGQVTEPSSTIDAGDVIGTDPEEGSLLGENEPITIIVSEGTPRIQVPDVVGLLADSARQTIENAGLTAAVDFIDVPADSPDVGRVVAQSPPAGIEVDQGATVTYTVGEAAAPPPTTEATTTTTTEAATTTTTTVAEEPEEG